MLDVENIPIFSLIVQNDSHIFNVMKILINYLLSEEGFPFLQHRCQNQTEQFIEHFSYKLSQNYTFPF